MNRVNKVNLANLMKMHLVNVVQLVNLVKLGSLVMQGVMSQSFKDISCYIAVIFILR